jgi:hypothetical protein
MSHKRVHVEVREDVPLHTRVTLRAGATNVANSASVTFVTHYGPTYILVLEIGEQSQSRKMTGASSASPG